MNNISDTNTTRYELSESHPNYPNSGHSYRLRGFTLVELLLYVGLVGTIIFSVSGVLSLFMQSRVKNSAISEVEQQGIQVMQIITQSSRNAEAITSPAQGTSASSLTLDVVIGAKDPTIFDLSSGVIRIKEGSSAVVSLTNSRVTASTLTFTNLSRSGTPGIVRVQFTLTHVNPEGRNEYNYSTNFYGTASLR